MPLTNAGAAAVASFIIDDGAIDPFDNASAHLGVGDDDTAFAAGQTDLQAATNKFRKAMEASYPQRTGAVLTFRALFGTGEANFDWKEWALFNADTGGVMLSRKVEDLGTKTSAQSWQLTVTVTVSAA